MSPDFQADRQASILWARRLLELDDWVILDTETTGLTTDDEAVEVCVVDRKGRPCFLARLKPSRPIPEAATAIHGITNAAVEHCLTFAVHWPYLKSRLTDKLIVAYNADFDRRILQQSAERYGISLPDLRWSCAMERYAAYVGYWDHSHGNYRFQQLPQASSLGAHGSFADCLSILAVIKHLAETEP